MYELDEIIYAKKPVQKIKVSGVRIVDDSYKLKLRFNNGALKIFDFEPLLKYEAFKPLMDKAIFKQVYLDYGTVVWNDGAIDYDPKTLYDNGITL